MNEFITKFIELFESWFKLKTALFHKENKVIFKQGEIWWCSLGFNIGEEIFGKGNKFTRPVLIFKKLTANSFMGLPLTTHGRKGSWYVEIDVKGEKQYILINQARILDKKRLTNKIDSISKADFVKVKKEFLEFYSS